MITTKQWIKYSVIVFTFFAVYGLMPSLLMYFLGYERSVDWNSGMEETRCLILLLNSEKIDEDGWNFFADVRYNITISSNNTYTTLEKQNVKVGSAYGDESDRNKGFEKYRIGSIHKCFYQLDDYYDLRFSRKNANAFLGGFFGFFFFGLIFAGVAAFWIYKCKRIK